MSQRTRRLIAKGRERTWRGDDKEVDKGAAGGQERGVTKVHRGGDRNLP